MPNGLLKKDHGPFKRILASKRTGWIYCVYFQLLCKLLNINSGCVLALGDGAIALLKRISLTFRLLHVCVFTVVLMVRSEVRVYCVAGEMLLVSLLLWGKVCMQFFKSGASSNVMWEYNSYGLGSLFASCGFKVGQKQRISQNSFVHSDERQQFEKHSVFYYKIRIKPCTHALCSRHTLSPRGGSRTSQGCSVRPPTARPGVKRGQAQSC